jgi:hypothetical protein
MFIYWTRAKLVRLACGFLVFEWPIQVYVKVLRDGLTQIINHFLRLISTLRLCHHAFLIPVRLLSMHS